MINAKLLQQFTCRKSPERGGNCAKRFLGWKPWIQGFLAVLT